MKMKIHKVIVIARSADQFRFIVQDEYNRDSPLRPRRGYIIHAKWGIFAVFLR
jgi:hypothetical protein